MCEIAFSTIEQIQQRILEEHMHGCETCGNKFKAKTLLKEHISVTNHLQKAHSVSCELCKDELSDQEELKKHIQHIHTFACETCDKSGYGQHFKSNHGSNSKTDKNKPSEKETFLENNLGRLETMYHEALEENNNLKSEYEAKLMTANDNLTTATEENEALAEKVDILFKFGRSYLNQSKTKTEDTDERLDKNNDEIPLK